MVNIQSEMISFNDSIKLSYDENKELRSKRDILLDKLESNITEEAASYTFFNQGSYAMRTGVKPDDGDYDIDVGLRFDIDKNNYPDPVAVKKWVYDALNGHTKSVEIRRSCVTVTYQKDGEAAFHVDFAVYAASNSDGKMYIAKGKANSGSDYRVWEESDPQGLIDYFQSLYRDDNDKEQFRRIVRYLKKWKNVAFSPDGNAAPTGIALTTLAASYFNPNYSSDTWTGKKTYDDFKALKNLVVMIKSAFVYCWDNDDQTYYYKIDQKLPVPPYNNLFEKMTGKQQNSFYQKVGDMLIKLQKVEQQNRKSEACKLMAEIFGGDFPITADRSYVGTSESA